MSNVLEKSDIDLFYKLYAKLLCFVNKQAKVLQPETLSPDSLLALPLEDRIKIRDALFNRGEYIDEFIHNESAQEFSSHELEILGSWKHFEKGKFFIYKHLKTHSIFLDDSGKGRAFAVSGISEPLDEMFPYTPFLVEAILIPFKDRIIYDGLIMGYSVHFGSGIRAGIKSSYEKAKHRSGLITQLPLNAGNGIEKGDVEQLKFYMKNKENRDRYWDEISKLSLKNKHLSDLFYQEMGKVNAPYFSKQLKRVGLEKKWFGIIDNTVVASGATKDQLHKNIAEIVPEDKANRVYIFKT